MFNQTLLVNICTVYDFSQWKCCYKHILVHKSLFQSLVIFSAEIPRSGIAGSLGRHISKVLDRYHEAAFLRVCRASSPPLWECPLASDRYIFSAPTVPCVSLHCVFASAAPLCQNPAFPIPPSERRAKATSSRKPLLIALPTFSTSSPPSAPVLNSS